MKEGKIVPYCDGFCEHLDVRKHICNLTNKRLSYSKGCYGIIHEHNDICKKDEESFERFKKENH